MGTHTTHTRQLVAYALRVALVGALSAAGWSIYRRLPHGDAGRADQAETRLRLVLRAPSPPDGTDFQLYPVDVYAVQRAARREFLSEPRRGARLEDFVRLRMRGHSPVEGQLDERGQATVVVPSGKWWVHLTLPGATELSWRLPVNVAGREQTVELTEENAYVRAKRF